MAIKIGKYYITRNNPRELLRTIKEKQEIIDCIEDIVEIVKIIKPIYNFKANE